MFNMFYMFYGFSGFSGFSGEGAAHKNIEAPQSFR